MLCLWRTFGPSITPVSQQEIAWKLSSKNIPVGGRVECLQVGNWKEELLVWDYPVWKSVKFLGYTV